MCVTTNTYSELETTVCSSDGAWQRRHNKSLDHYETITNSSVGSSLKPINTCVFLILSSLWICIYHEKSSGMLSENSVFYSGLQWVVFLISVF